MARSALICACLALAMAACEGDAAPARPPSPPPGAAAATPDVTPATAATPGPMVLRLLAPSPAEPAADEAFTVVVEVSDAADLAAYQFTPSYDPAVVELVSITDLGFLASTGRAATCDQTGTPPGPVTQFCVTLGAAPAGPSGDGNLAVLQFRALAAGTTDVTLQGAAATGPDGRDLPLETAAVRLTVAP